jgi:hypothetical protein
MVSASLVQKREIMVWLRDLGVATADPLSIVEDDVDLDPSESTSPPPQTDDVHVEDVPVQMTVPAAPALQSASSVG